MGEQRVAQAMVKTAKLYLRISSAGLARFGLQQGQDVLLRLLWERDGLPQSELGTTLSVEPPTITKMLTRLQKAGFLKRRRDPAHAKQWRVYLTAKGRHVEAQVQAHWASLEAVCTRGMTLLEKRTFIELALRIRENLTRSDP